MTASPLNRATLAEQVAQAILAKIHAEQLAPGDTLPSTARLAEEFGVSRPVIREALKTLEGQAIIEVTNGRAPVVKPINSLPLRAFFQRAIALDHQSTLELLEVRRGIEVQSALLAAARRDEADAAALKELVQVMENALGNPAAYAELDLSFHMHIAAATRNSMLTYLVESIRDALRGTIVEGLRSRFTQEQTQRVQAIHARIAAEIGAGNSVGAAEAMAAHFDDAIHAVYLHTQRTTDAPPVAD
ncbi:MAG: FadR family transcriptional regulator [Anaerolineae bacterium]|nr:FadR family transcriptional regulator [Anaerolineae bacterium]